MCMRCGEARRGERGTEAPALMCWRLGVLDYPFVVGKLLAAGLAEHRALSNDGAILRRIGAGELRRRIMFRCEGYV